MEAALISVAFVLILLGCAFVFLPGLPGPIVAWTGPFVYFAFSKAPPEEALPFIGAGTLVASGVLALLALAFDFLSSWWGAAKFGATWRGGIGALVGAIAGPVVFSPLGGFIGMLIGLAVGPIVGALVGELLGGRGWREGARAGWGPLIGALAATAVKLLYCTGVFAWMLAATLADLL